MEKTEQHKFGLVGKNISYSFSRGYFKKKFQDLGLENYSYENFDLNSIEVFPSIFSKNNTISGLNVTIPYKEEVIPYLDHIDHAAQQIGAVNTIKIDENGLTGFNTDAYGFKNAILPHIQPHHNDALILGTGGASKAIAFVLDELGIDYRFVSRSGKKNGFRYDELTGDTIEKHTLIINCSPVGTFPNIEEKPALPYTSIGQKHLLFDLIYNPEVTAFLQTGKLNGARICNGLRMLELQAEKAWSIWNNI
ncbi:shikimate dehydrogenase [Maribacter sedimenticola]|uniref:Shikimate dehydrogenase n=1 Tax=Maribacter sedimenticola TaxID=228956 RepID=A0ABY1SK72_9FLAO|nr:shikimate dehydrogenase [Maribacter sedimenticola]SNR68525.1 shikimate dehydrogenase [Maribacter sedimenticola]